MSCVNADQVVLIRRSIDVFVDTDEHDQGLVPASHVAVPIGLWNDIGEALDSVHRQIVFHARDWAPSPHDAWLYGLVVGWDDEDGITEDNDAMAELAERHGWDDEFVALLRRRHAALEVARAGSASGPGVRSEAADTDRPGGAS